MEKKSSFKDILKEPQNIIALGVTIISICALMVSIMQTRIMSEQRALMYEQAKVSVWPRINIGRYKSHEVKDNKIIEYQLNLTNAGVGPAIVTDVKVSFNGEPITSWSRFFRKLKLDDSIPTFYGTSDLSNSIIKIGANVTVLNLNENLQLAQKLFEQENNMRIEIWYKSIYNDKWKVTYEKQKCTTEEVDSDFSLPDDEQFEN